VIPALAAYRSQLVTPMPRLASALLLAVVAVAPASGEDANPDRKPAPSRGVPNVDVWIPVDPGPHENVYWFDGRTHHGAPGTVTINRPGYICDLDRRAFSRREDFVDHLQRKHKVPPDHVADSLVTIDGQVHFRNE